jgi:hypothetical protein
VTVNRLSEFISTTFMDVIAAISTGLVLKGNHFARSHSFVIGLEVSVNPKALCFLGLRTIYLAFGLAQRLPAQDREICGYGFLRATSLCLLEGQI